MSGMLRNHKALIIGDEKSWANSTAHWLRTSFPGLEVVVAASGHQGIREAERLVPDVFIVDIMLQDMNGLQITRHLRNTTVFAETPIVLITVIQTNDQMLIEALGAGADLYFQKPFEATEFKNAIEKCLVISDARKDLAHKKEQLTKLQSALLRDSVISSVKHRPNLMFEQRALRALRLIESAPDAIAITLPCRVMLEVNNMLCQYTGYSQYELVGYPFSMLFSSATLQEIPFECDRVLSGEIVEQERQLLHKSGLEIPVWMKSMLLPDGTVVTFMRDNTRVRRAEQELLKQREFSMKITDKIPNIVYIHDLLLRRNIFVNRSIAQLLGYPPETLTDDAEGFLDQVLHPEDLKMFDDFYENADLGDPGLVFHFEYRMKTYKGEWRWFKGHERVWEQQDGRITKLIGTVLDFTSEKEKEEALVKSEKKFREMMELFRSLSDNMPDMLWAKDVNNRYIFTNRAICDHLLCATDTNEPIGKTDMFFANRIRNEQPDNPKYHTFGEICRDSDQLVFQAKKPVQIDEFGNVRGKFLYLDVIKAPIFNERGEIVAVVGAGRDITERKRQEKHIAIQHAVAHSLVTTDNLRTLIMTIERELAQLLDTSNFYVALINQVTGKLYTPFLKDLVDNIDEWDIEGSATGLVIRSGKRQLLRKADLEALIDTGKLRAIGTMAAVWMGAPLLCNNEVVGAIVLQNYEDENAFSEQDVELLEFLANQLGVYIQRSKTLEQTRMLGMAVEQSPVGVMITDASGRVVYNNKRFAEISGYDAAVLKIVTSEVLMQIFGDEKIAEEIISVLDGNKSWSRELLLSRPDKSQVWISFSLSPVFDEQGKPGNWLVIAEDNTEKRRMLDELIEARDKAQESDRLKSAFLMNMSHEIRTPLNSIMGFADLLAGHTNSLDEVRTQGSVIYRNGQRLLELINNILKISKIDAGAEAMTLVRFNAAQLIQDVIVSMRPQASKQEIQLLMEISPEDLDLWIEADRLKIHQVIDNLMSNALKFTASGSITVGLNRNGSLLRFFVKDTGRGIPKSELDKIFDRFYQSSTSLNRGYEGVGLGLALCRSMVSLMEGKIWAESEENKGSVFFFEIPLKIIENKTKDEVPRAANRKPEGQSPNLAGNTILIADDDEPSRFMMKALLSALGCTTYFASNGLEALEMLNRHPEINIAFIDIKMPILDGLETLKRIRQSGNKLILVATTAFALPGDEHRFRSEGFDDYLAKPLTRLHVVKMLEKHLH